MLGSSSRLEIDGRVTRNHLVWSNMRWVAILSTNRHVLHQLKNKCIKVNLNWIGLLWKWFNNKRGENNKDFEGHICPKLQDEHIRYQLSNNGVLTNCVLFKKTRQGSESVFYHQSKGSSNVEFQLVDDTSWTSADVQIRTETLPPFSNNFATCVDILNCCSAFC